MSTTSFTNNSNSDDPPPTTDGSSAGSRRVVSRTESTDGVPALPEDELQTRELKSSSPEQLAAEAASASEEQEIAKLRESTIH